MKKPDQTSLHDSARPRTTPDARSARPSRRDERRAREARDRRRSILLVAGVAILLVIATMAGVKLLSPNAPPAPGEGPVSPSVLRDLTGVPQSVANSIGQGSATNLPTPVRAELLRGPRGLPRIIYIGAEFCPYCAAERWAMVVALSRFGQFEGLRTARSALDDVYPGTPTFSFYGATYTSPYLEFEAVETQTSTRVGSSYQTLQTPTPEQQQLIDRFDAPPYVAPENAGAIPFIDIANQYVLAGTTFSPGLLANQSWESIAANVAKGNTDQARAIIGSANVLTAAICAATSDSPASVCKQPSIQQIEATLAKSPAPSTGG
jgi:hypothetical protein